MTPIVIRPQPVSTEEIVHELRRLEAAVPILCEEVLADEQKAAEVRAKLRREIRKFWWHSRLRWLTVLVMWPGAIGGPGHILFWVDLLGASILVGRGIGYHFKMKMGERALAAIEPAPARLLRG